MQEFILNPLGRAIERDPAPAERAGTREEFESQLAEISPLAFRVAHGVLRNAADAEDVAQDALLRAYRGFHKLRDPARRRTPAAR